MQRHLLALDLDGTTCDDAGRLSGRTKQALAAARTAGHLVCFATGRRDIDMLPFAQDARCADYLVLNNGGKIVRMQDEAVLHNTFVDADVTRRLVEHCLRHGHQLHVVSGLYWGVNRMGEAVRAYANTLGVEPVLYTSADDVPCAQVEGFMATADLVPIGAFIDAAGLPLLHVPSEPHCEDIMPKGVTKWGGLLWLLHHLRLSPQQVIAAGDYDNDIPMLQGAGFAMAVKNARQSVKAVADYVSPYANSEDAVADLIERRLLAQSDKFPEIYRQFT